MKMKKSLVLTLMIAAIAGYPVMPLGSKEFEKIEIAHSTALGDSWEIRDMKLMYQIAIGIMGETDNPVSGNVAPVYKTLTFDLKEKDIEAMLKIFFSNDWQKLKTDYGASEGERNYPESIRLKDSKGGKTVVFRDSPGSEKDLPKQFRIIADEIDKIVREYLEKK